MPKGTKAAIGTGGCRGDVPSCPGRGGAPNTFVERGDEPMKVKVLTLRWSDETGGLDDRELAAVDATAEVA